MFWRSVGYGLLTLTNWEVWVGIVCLGLANVLFMTFIPCLFGLSRSPRGLITASGLHLIGGPMIQALATSAFVLMLLPSLLGDGGFTPLSIAKLMIPRTVKVGLLALLVVIMLYFVPLVGRLVAYAPGLASFIQGALILHPLAKGMLITTLGPQQATAAVFPGILSCAGYFVIALVLIWVALLAIGLAEATVRRLAGLPAMASDSNSNGLTAVQQPLALFVCPAMGVVPLLMYGQYIALGLRQSAVAP